MGITIFIEGYKDVHSICAMIMAKFQKRSAALGIDLPPLIGPQIL